jgi:2-dehydro-3-deoxyphosphogluconate aldolase / (4S)-4-hydroxy-2-oxoglutarate aldolase
VGPVERIVEERVVAILRNVGDPEAVVDGLGLPIVEITLDSPGALDAIANLRARGDVTVLAGTVRTAAEARAAAEAGAEVIVGPVSFVPEVVALCSELGVPSIPGALTPTELEAAWRSGAALVKLFPGRLVGPEYVRDVLAPLADLRLIVTGGIDATNAREFLAAGAVAVGADASRARAVYDAVRLDG